MRLILVRHGESESNAEMRFGDADTPLTPRGHQQAKATARWLAQHASPEIIVASTMKRALDTAHYFAKPFGLTPVANHLLREVDLGDLENLTPEEAAAKHPETWERNLDFEDVDFGWPGGETRRAFFARVRLAFARLPSVGTGQDLLVVSHGGVLSSYLAELLEGRPQYWHRYVLGNCAITSLAVDGDSTSVLDLNNTSHLGDIGTVQALS